MDGDNMRINDTPKNTFKHSFCATLNRLIPFWKSAPAKHWTPSLFKYNIYIKCLLIAAFKSLTEAVSSINFLFLRLRSQSTLVWKIFLVLIFYQVWKTRAKIISGSTCIRKTGFSCIRDVSRTTKTSSNLGRGIWIKPSTTYLRRDSSKLSFFRPKKTSFFGRKNHIFGESR